MLEQLLHLRRPLVCFDVETTGLKPTSCRIVELAFQIYEPEKGLTKEWQSLIEPECAIPAETTAIHGIDAALLLKCTHCWEPKASCTCEVFHRVPTFREIAANLTRGFAGCDYAGKNIRFDLQVLDAEMRRAGVSWSYSQACIIDAERLEQLAVPRTLAHLHQKYVGLVHDTAHRALSDVRATATVIAMQLREHPQLSRDLDTLHRAQWPRWIDNEGKFRFNADGVPCFGPWGKYANQPMKDTPSSYWDFILDKDFSEEIKDLARHAKHKRFPTKVD